MISKEITINNRTINNRVVFQPMEGCDGTRDGSIDTLTRRRYMRFADSGAGIIWFEAVAVKENGRANPRQLWLREDNLESFKSLISDMKKHSLEKYGYEQKIIIQLTHSGRYSKPNGTPEPLVMARNEVWEVGKEDQPYRIITDEELDELPSFYAKSAKLAREAGFDGVDVKCCHGYLMDETLSAYTREGKYGGSFENRTRLYRNCLDAVIEAVGDDMIVTSRLSGYDGFKYPYGYGASEDKDIDLTEPKKILQMLQEKGIEMVNITIGNPYVVPHINRPFMGGPEDGKIGVERVTNITRELQAAFPDLKIVMSALTYNGVDSMDYAQKMLEENVCSLCGFGRMTFAYPQFYQDYLKNGELDKNKVCIKCGNCSKMMRAGGVAGCPVRDKETYMPLYKQAMENVK